MASKKKERQREKDREKENEKENERKKERKKERKSEDRKKGRQKESFQSWILLSDIAKEDSWLTWNSAPNVRSRKSIRDQAGKAVD